MGNLPHGGGGYPTFPGKPWASPASPQALGNPGPQGFVAAPGVSTGVPNTVNGEGPPTFGAGQNGYMGPGH